MDLSIIIVNYKTPELVKKCVSSIKKYPVNFEYEIVVIDNSVDNVGFAKGVNKGIKNAKGKYILLLNSDTEVKKDSINKLINFAIDHPDAGAVAPKLLNNNGSTQGSVFKFPSIFRAIRQYWFGEKGILDKYSPNNLSSVEAVSMAAFLITPIALEKIGTLNEKYFMYFEDLDYCREVNRKGLKVYYFPDSVVTHYHGKSGENLVDDKNQWRRLIPSSKLYHGTLVHYLIMAITWLGQKIGKLVPIILLTLLTIPAFYNLLRPGFFPMQDDLQAFRVYEMDRCYDDLQIPCRWVPDAGYQYGYPQFNFYPPFPYYIGAGLHRVGIQYIDSVKILFVAGYILSAMAMYLLISTLFKSSWAGIVAGAIYTYIPYKAVEVYVRGALSEFWAQIFFPLIFWAIYKLIKSGEKKYVIWLGVSIAFLATTHTLMTMIFAPIAGLWAIYWLFSEKWNNLIKVVWGGLFGFGLSAFFLLPVIFEKKFVHVESLLSGYFDYRAHFVSLYKLFLSTEWGYGSSGFPNEQLNLSLGIIQWVVGLGAIILALANFKKNRKFSLLAFYLSLVTLFSIFMIHMKSSFIWTMIPPLWYLQFPWRFLAVSIFLLCLLTGFFIHFSGKYKYILGVLIITIAFAANISFFVPKSWLNISDIEKFSEISWEKQLTISIFDYLPIYGVLPPWSKATDYPEVLSGNLRFVEYKKGSNFQTGIVEATKDSLIRIPLFDFPGMEVKVDGKKIYHDNNNCSGERYCRGLITFKVPSGKHNIDTRLKNTPIRSFGNTLTLISFGVLGYLIFKSKK
ncbi:MAG TPA: glycosyltransferase [Patescibacteria group bacterium]|nr:glycosyltransferase [Patescibacteria group bacterium]